MSAPRTDGSSTDGSSTDGLNTEVRGKTILEQLGGVPGLVSSSLPVLVFVIVNAATGLTPAIWSAVGAGTAIAVWRLVRREALQPAVSGLLGVAVAAYVAHRTGSAKGFFLLGIWTSVLYGSAFVVSVLVRWPLVGVAWSLLNGHGWSWRQSREAVRSYDVASLAWAVLFFARFAVQYWLYNSDQTGWLAAARIAMGWPLTGAVLLLTVWVVRRGDRAAAAAEETVRAAVDPPDVDGWTR
ncbi:DUF3159 domain-containing protein [Rhodococcus antarcticus]|uniref:DUF3159 domain-containing protein n=1 Tax=Rhodococcus antarcticus TaxID=2987751 RepID=A0ABY6P319_9NOCA|nr:DUF3159 domain-containing protein [Rhodococcus antarcticus]UZJ25908.1 DUF3159 domain-containing protein [Rhodococcus antarcticus]